MINIIIFFIFFVTISINSINSQSLSPRYGHSSTYINSTIYILGGIIDNDLTNEFFSINVSSSSIASLQTQLTYLNTKTNMDFILPHAFAQTSPGLSVSSQTTGKNTLYLFGGTQNNLFEFYLSKVFAYDTNLNQWIRPNVDKTPAQKHSSFRTIFSNYTEDFNSIYTFSVRGNFSEVDLFDTSTLSWYANFTTYSFGIVHGFTSTMLRNGIVVYFGGSIIGDGNNQGFGGELFSREHQFMRTDFLNIYDTKTNSWGSQETVGEFPDSRTMHSAVVTLDGRIIIYGGINQVILGTASSGSDSKKYPNPLIAILETSSRPFHWTTLQLGNNSVEPLQSYGHTATMAGNYMVVAFGMQSNVNAKPNTISSFNNSFTPSDSIYIMDTTNKTHIVWSKFEYSLIDFPIHHIYYTQAQQIGIIIGFSALGIFAGFVLTFCGVKCCCNKKNSGPGAVDEEGGHSGGL